MANLGLWRAGEHRRRLVELVRAGENAESSPQESATVT